MQKRQTYLIAGALIALLVGLPFLPGLWSSIHSYGLVVNKPAPDFKLTNTAGEQRQLVDFQGEFLYLYFGYLNCNGVCQTHIATFFHLAKQTPEKDFKIAFITLDPARDSAELLAQRIDGLDPRFIGLRAESTHAIQQLALAYKVPFYQTSQATEYEINHAGFVFLIDKNGQWRRTYTGRFLDYTKMQQDLTTLRLEQTNPNKI